MAAITGTGCVFPCMSPRVTARYYVEQLGFIPEYHLDGTWPHINLCRDGAFLILTQSNWKEVIPNRQLYGGGYDVCFRTDDPEGLLRQYSDRELQIVRGLETDEEGNPFFILEDIDGRWIAFSGRKNPG